MGATTGATALILPPRYSIAVLLSSLLLLGVGLMAVVAVAIIGPVLGKPWTNPGSAGVAVSVTTAEAVPSTSPSSPSSMSP